MKEFFFYTAEGTTYGPNGEDVENCQVLGRGFGNDVSEARENLLKRSPWIIEKGFDPYEAMHVVLDSFDFSTFLFNAKKRVYEFLGKDEVINLSTHNIHDIKIENSNCFVEEVFLNDDNDVTVSFANDFGYTYSKLLGSCHEDTIDLIVKCLSKND